MLPQGTSTSEDVIIAQEFERRTKEADEKYSAYEEALAVFEGDSSPEVIGHLESLYRAWEAAEELRDEMAETDGGVVEAVHVTTGAEMF